MICAVLCYFGTIGQLVTYQDTEDAWIRLMIRYQRAFLINALIRQSNFTQSLIQLLLSSNTIVPLQK
jgi:hypothetical protein